MVGMTLAVSFVSGPLIGGMISHYSDWRWLFNMNIPIGLLAILGITNLWPQEDVAHLFSWDAFKKIDFLGNIALHLASGLVVFALQQAGSQSSAWESPEIISTFIISGMCFAVFIWWEVALGSRRFGRIEPVFPIRLILNRVYSAGLMVTMLTGFPYIALTIIIPERFQIVDGQDALMAGIHILPMLGACAVGSFLGGIISSKRNNTSYTMVGASALQVLGVSLMTMLSRSGSPSDAQYAYQAIFGLGVGLSFSAATIMTNVFASEQSDRASAQGAVAQARVFGGCIGLALCTVIFNSHVNKFLASHLSEQEIEDLHRSPLAGLQLPLNQQELVKSVYAGAFAEQIKVMAAICAVMVAVSLFSLERHPTPLRRPASMTKDAESSRRGSDSATELNEVSSIRLQAV
ncbi:putative MFS-type transporter [Escovopsis weberi]|uniref:Putative MFS-type transporter n=1 Tax=Escovopsis weberi TaxID=150374 RepID=A0A0M9VWH1_ESCWE|nr:putative MFS-type transporter [Escovopsis weberi]